MYLLASSLFMLPCMADIANSSSSSNNSKDEDIVTTAVRVLTKKIIFHAKDKIIFLHRWKRWMKQNFAVISDSSVVSAEAVT